MASDWLHAWLLCLPFPFHSLLTGCLLLLAAHSEQSSLGPFVLCAQQQSEAFARKKLQNSWILFCLLAFPSLPFCCYCFVFNLAHELTATPPSPPTAAPFPVGTQVETYVGNALAYMAPNQWICLYVQRTGILVVLTTTSGARCIARSAVRWGGAATIDATAGTTHTLMDSLMPIGDIGSTAETTTCLRIIECTITGKVRLLCVFLMWQFEIIIAAGIFLRWMRMRMRLMLLLQWCGLFVLLFPVQLLDILWHRYGQLFDSWILNVLHPLGDLFRNAAAAHVTCKGNQRNIFRFKLKLK